MFAVAPPNHAYHKEFLKLKHSMAVCAGYKTFGDPDFDFQSSCVTVETCLQLIQSWSVNHTNHIPITIYLEPRESTLFGNSASVNQQLAAQPGNPQQ